MGLRHRGRKAIQTDKERARSSWSTATVSVRVPLYMKRSAEIFIATYNRQAAPGARMSMNALMQELLRRWLLENDALVVPRDETGDE